MKSIFTLFCALFLLIFSPSLMAQGMDYLEDEGSSLWESDSFVDPGSAEMGSTPGSSTHSKEYVPEEEVQAMEEAEQKRRDSNVRFSFNLENAQTTAPDNLTYGAATGGILGAWIAFDTTASYTSQQKARFVGTGIVLGLLAGSALTAQPMIQTGQVVHPKEPIFDTREPVKPTDALARFTWGFQF